MSRLLIAVALCVCAEAASAQTLRIYHIDVEQGASTLFVAPNGRTLLFDSGKNGHGQRIQAVMQQAGVSQIDLFVNSHYHEDHFGGIDDLVDLKVPVLEAFDRGDKNFLPQSKKNEVTYKDYQRTVGEDAQPLRRGHTLDLDASMTIICIGSGGTVIGENPPTTGHKENDMSVSLLITFGGFRYFIGGDTESSTEAKMAARDLVMNIDVYQAHHHGSHTSSSVAFMADANPTVVMISNGNRVDYAHPRKLTLNSYTKLKPSPTVFQTNKYLAGGPLGGGNVEDSFIADPETNDDDGTILMTVDGPTSTYTVTYGTAKHSFTIKAGAPPTPTTPAGVVIDSLLPNPVGADEQREEVTLRNRGTTAVSLAGWHLRDRSGLHWDLTGTVAAGQSRIFRRNGQAMTLNNQGDEIVLLDQATAERDRFVYASSTEGTTIKTLH